jgi:hypothetical protein
LAVSLYKIGNDIRLMSCGPTRRRSELGKVGQWKSIRIFAAPW